MSTQWRLGMGGVVGLDYNALPFVMDCSGVALEDRPPVFNDIRVMESEALRTIHKFRPT